MLFRPRSEKVRVMVWIESGKREVDAQSPCSAPPIPAVVPVKFLCLSL